MQAIRGILLGDEQMKICFLNHNLNAATGAGRFGVNLIERLRRADPQLDAVVLTALGSGHPLEAPILHQRFARLVLAVPRIRALMQSCDVIHALDGFPYGVIAALASIGLGKKFIITAIGTGAIRPFRRAVRGRLLAWAYRRADRVVAISGYTRREILAHLPGLAIKIINHAVDYREFSGDLMAPLTAEERSAIAAMKPYVLSVGGWKRRKGFEYSFPAFAKIRKRFPEMGYVVCGIGPKPRLEEPFDLQGSVSYFKGVRWPFLKALYAHAELFMLLSVDDGNDVEGFGLAFLEAAAAGVPVIGTEGSGAEDAVRDGENGFLVAPQNAPAAAEAAIRILSDRALAGRFSAGSRRLAREMSWEAVAERYAALYRGLMASR